jgi:hypothetical protein
VLAITAAAQAGTTSFGPPSAELPESGDPPAPSPGTVDPTPVVVVEGGTDVVVGVDCVLSVLRVVVVVGPGSVTDGPGGAGLPTLAQAPPTVATSTMATIDISRPRVVTVALSTTRTPRQSR